MFNEGYSQTIAYKCFCPTASGADSGILIVAIELTH